jgi:hypothetical protein
MRRVVHKYPLQIGAITSFEVPSRNYITAVGMSGGVPCIWMEVDLDTPGEIQSFEVLGTGWPIPNGDPMPVHVGTLFQGQFVWHVYQVPNPSI